MVQKLTTSFSTIPSLLPTCYWKINFKSCVSYSYEEINVDLICANLIGSNISFRLGIMELKLYMLNLLGSCISLFSYKNFSFSFLGFDRIVHLYSCYTG